MSKRSTKKPNQAPIIAFFARCSPPVATSAEEDGSDATGRWVGMDTPRPSKIWAYRFRCGIGTRPTGRLRRHNTVPWAIRCQEGDIAFLENRYRFSGCDRATGAKEGRKHSGWVRFRGVAGKSNRHPSAY